MSLLLCLSLVCINIDSFGVVICYSSSRVIRRQKSFPQFSRHENPGKLRVRFELQVGNPTTNLAEIWPTYRLSDSFSKKPSLRILISFFFFELDFFFTGSANDLLSLTSNAYNKRTNSLDKNLRHCFLSNVLRSECDLNWLIPFTFGWPELKFTVTTTFTKSFSFLNRVYILIFLKGRE